MSYEIKKIKMLPAKQPFSMFKCFKIIKNKGEKNV